MTPQAKGGSNRLGNLTLACEPCNIRKGTQDIRLFLAHQPDLLKKLLAQAQASLKDAAAVNTIRWVLYERLKAFGLPVECGSGGLTKFNRTVRGLDKAHWLDAACVGKSTPEVLHTTGVVSLHIRATGHGSRQMCRMNKYGFPCTRPKQVKQVKGFQTGDLVRAVVLSGKEAGTYVGRVAVRTSGSFKITTATRVVQHISHRYCTALHHSDGYHYQKGSSRHSRF